TVAVHVAALLIAIVDGVHDTVVVVGWSPPTETVPLPLLVAWTLSVGLYVPVTVAVPAVEPAVNVTEHVPEARVQLVGLTDDPVAVPVTMKLTVPAGVDDPAPLVSVTVATQLDVPRTVTELGVQTTEGDGVLRITATVEGEQSTLRVTVFLVTVTLAVLGPLPEWAVSPPYVPLIVWVPVPMTVGVYVTEHLPALRVHVVLLKVPVPLLVKVTVPVG